MQFVTRDQWGAKPARGPYTQQHGGEGTAIHWFGGTTPTGDHSQCAPLVRSIQEGAFQRTDAFYDDIEYNFLCCIHGYVFAGRGAGVRPAAQLEFNSQYFAVAALLGPSGGWTSPTEELFTALCDAVDDLRATAGAGPKVVTHASLMSTDCPGSALTAWVQEGAHRPGAPTPAPEPIPAPPAVRTVTVGTWPGPDSTLWDIAENHLGDPNRWRQLYSLNAKTIGDDPNSVHPGMVLELP